MTDIDLHEQDDPRPGAHGPLMGLVFATVSDVEDPKKQGRVKLLLPTYGDAVESTWARVLAPGAGKTHAVWWPLEVGDEVIVGFVGGHPEHPVVLGSLFSPKKLDLVPEASRRAHHLLATPAGHTVRLDDTKDAHKLEIVTAGGENAIAFDVAKGKLTITAKTILEIKVGADITLTMTEGKVTLKCKELAIPDAKDISVTGAGAITLDAKQSLALKGGQAVTINDGALEVTK